MRKPYRLGFPRIDWPFHERISRLSFELVHAHCPFSSGALAMQIAREQHVPIVATFHSKYRADFERAIPSRLLVNYLIRKVIRFYEAADEVWIPQAAVEETLREYGYKGRIEVVDNGNDFAGTPFLQSVRQESDIPFRMYFVGSGYASHELKQKVVELGLASKVSFVGSIVEREILKRYYVAADLFLFPSLYDNAPLVIREAAALGTPSGFYRFGNNLRFGKWFSESQ